jgi:hypothetical protein
MIPEIFKTLNGIKTGVDWVMAWYGEILTRMSGVRITSVKNGQTLNLTPDNELVIQGRCRFRPMGKDHCIFLRKGVDWWPQEWVAFLETGRKWESRTICQQTGDFIVCLAEISEEIRLLVHNYWRWGETKPIFVMPNTHYKGIRVLEEIEVHIPALTHKEAPMETTLPDLSGQWICLVPDGTAKGGVCSIAQNKGSASIDLINENGQRSAGIIEGNLIRCTEGGWGHLGAPLVGHLRKARRPRINWENGTVWLKKSLGQ